MKPLLPVPLTIPDQYIWLNWVWRIPSIEEWDADRLQSISIAADRRDAALMLQVQRTIRKGIDWNVVRGPCFANAEHIAVLGRPIWAPR